MFPVYTVQTQTHSVTLYVYNMMIYKNIETYLYGHVEIGVSEVEQFMYQLCLIVKCKRIRPDAVTHCGINIRNSRI